jgi:transcriptional antiterminator NusG
MDNQATATEEAQDGEQPTEVVAAAAEGDSPPAQEPAVDEPTPADEAGEDVAAEAVADQDEVAEPVEEVAGTVPEPADEETSAGLQAADAVPVDTPDEASEPEAATVAEEPAAEGPEVGEASADGETAAGEAEEEDAAPAPVEPLSPYDLPGDWYVIHSYSGYENKVKANLETRVHSMHMESNIFDVVIPMEDVVEIKGGKKVTVPKKVFPGYILVRMYMGDDAWFTVRNTPGVTGFVGSPTKPIPLSRREVERILGVRKEEEAKAEPRFKPAWDVGEQVRVVDGPFADFNGIIEEINVDQSKVRVLVNIFGRETPVELSFEQIIKI